MSISREIASSSARVHDWRVRCRGYYVGAVGGFLKSAISGEATGANSRPMFTWASSKRGASAVTAGLYKTEGRLDCSTVEWRPARRPSMVARDEAAAQPYQLAGPRHGVAALVANVPRAAAALREVARWPDDLCQVRAGLDRGPWSMATSTPSMALSDSRRRSRSLATNTRGPQRRSRSSRRHVKGASAGW